MLKSGRAEQLQYKDRSRPKWWFSLPLGGPHTGRKGWSSIA